MKKSILQHVFLISLCLLNALNLIAQNFSQDTVSSENFKEGLNLSGLWVFHPGDSVDFSLRDFDDSKWTVYSKENEEKHDSLLNKLPRILWYRSRVFISPDLQGKLANLVIIAKDACEIFLDGKKIGAVGIMQSEVQKAVSGFSLRPKPIPFVLDSGTHVIAIRYSHFSKGSDGRDVQFDVLNKSSGFQVSIQSLETSLQEMNDTSDIFIISFFTGLFVTLSLFHFVLFLFYRSNRSNLYYSIFTLFLFIIFYGIYKVISGSDLYTTTRLGFLTVVSAFCVPLFFIALLHQIFYKRLLIPFWILATTLFSGIVLFVFTDYQGAGGISIIVFLLYGIFEMLRVYVKAWKKKKEGSGIFLLGILIPPLGTIGLSILAYILSRTGLEVPAEAIRKNLGAFFGYSMLLSVSVSMTIYLARDFSRMNIKLSDQLNEIRQLFRKTIAQEHEKKQILENQKTDLERMVKERTAELASKNRDILDNLHYARRIQSAILPEGGMIASSFSESFIIYRPKDIVSGDFYSFSKKDNTVIFSVADCTGHGVTGAFLSMIGLSLINQLVNEQGITQPAQILNLLNSGMLSSLKHKSSDINDGMDIALCSYNLATKKLEFAGANRPLYIIHQDKLLEIKSDKMAIGGFRLNESAVFTNHSFSMETGDSIYLFTDGFVDQFGGADGKKLLAKRMRDYLLSISSLSMHEQEIKLNHFFDEWKGKNEQVDDVLVIGVRC